MDLVTGGELQTAGLFRAGFLFANFAALQSEIHEFFEFRVFGITLFEFIAKSNRFGKEIGGFST